jgi:hypothetical protein
MIVLEHLEGSMVAAGPQLDWDTAERMDPEAEEQSRIVDKAFHHMLGAKLVSLKPR